MAGINDYAHNLRRIDEWLRRNKTPRAVIFDVGTRAARVMVGPKKLAAATSWNEGTFFTAGFVTALGGDVEPVSQVLHVGESPALVKLADFINDTMAVLRANGVPDTNIVAIGTEVFRSLSDANLGEVIAWLKQQTGLTLQVIDGKTEARLSLIAAFMTHKLNLPAELWLDANKGERFLLIDQGGGSTEISFAISQQKAQLESKADLGTVTLRRMFFGGLDGVDAESNHATIPEQYERVLAYVRQRVESYEFPKQSFKIAYGLGTAVTACFPGTNNWKIHNQPASIEFLSNVERKRCETLAANYSSVAELYNAIEQEKDDNRHVKMDKEVLVLYGLPVFRMILEKASFSEIRICGFPLRYGAFIVWHHAGWGWDLRPRPAAG